MAEHPAIAAGAGAGGIAPPDPRKSVFINCPYDPEYEPLADALLLAVVVCGFTPRSALESGLAAIPRVERIFHAIHTSKYSIHDLSRCRGEGDAVLARFNMPLELGMAMFRRFASDEEHNWLVLVPENAAYHKFVSDLAGYDLPKYDGKEESIVRRVVAWLTVHPEALSGVKPSDVLSKLPRFRAEKAKLKAEWGEVRWWDLVGAASGAALGEGVAVSST